MGRPMTFRGRKPTSSSSSSSSTEEVGNLLSILSKAGFCFIFKHKLLRKGAAVGGGRLDDLAVLDLSSVRAALERSFHGRYPIHQVRHFCYLFNLFVSYV